MKLISLCKKRQVDKWNIKETFEIGTCTYGSMLSYEMAPKIISWKISGETDSLNGEKLAWAFLIPDTKADSDNAIDKPYEICTISTIVYKVIPKRWLEE